MRGADRFIDSNVLLYLLSSDANKAARAEEELAAGGVVSVQVLNEFAAVAIRKAKLSVPEVREALETIRSVCLVRALTESVHERGLDVVARYRLSVYDAMIVASALDAGCTVLLTEDLQDGQDLGGLAVRNPFRQPSG